MGIRYYVYAFDADQTEAALADPMSIVSDDPTDNLWGEPFRALDLDKAWRIFQRLTEPLPGEEVRPAYRMFEGEVRHHDRGWQSFTRAIPPQDLPDIYADLRKLWVNGIDQVGEEDACYAMEYLKSAELFVEHLISTNQGFSYAIG